MKNQLQNYKENSSSNTQASKKLEEELSAQTEREIKLKETLTSLQMAYSELEKDHAMLKAQSQQDFESKGK